MNRYKRKNNQIVSVGNVTQKVLTAIELVLIIYFECKRGFHSEASLRKLSETMKYFNAQLSILWELKESLLGNKPSLPYARKQHFMVHIPESIALIGAASNFDTSGFEHAHKFYTNGVWQKTSKRL